MTTSRGRGWGACVSSLFMLGLVACASDKDEFVFEQPDGSLHKVNMAHRMRVFSNNSGSVSEYDCLKVLVSPRFPSGFSCIYVAGSNDTSPGLFSSLGTDALAIVNTKVAGESFEDAMGNIRPDSNQTSFQGGTFNGGNIDVDQQGGDVNQNVDDGDVNVREGDTRVDVGVRTDVDTRTNVGGNRTVVNNDNRHNYNNGPRRQRQPPTPPPGPCVGYHCDN